MLVELCCEKPDNEFLKKLLGDIEGAEDDLSCVVDTEDLLEGQYSDMRDGSIIADAPSRSGKLVPRRFHWSVRSSRWHRLDTVSTC